jgi:hypothetical protein
LLLVAFFSAIVWLYFKYVELQKDPIQCKSQTVANDQLTSLLQLSLKSTNEKSLILDSNTRIAENLQRVGVNESFISAYGKEILLFAVFSLGCLGIYSFITINSTSVTLFKKQAESTKEMGDLVIRNVTDIVVNTLTQRDSVLMTKLSVAENNNIAG